MNKLHAIIRKHAKELQNKVQGYREHIHQHPELSFEEHKTMQFVADTLSEIGLEPKVGVGGTGVVALIQGKQHQKNANCVGLRADLDALPIQEETGASYQSKIDGVMHACGHDVHTSILLGTAELLVKLKDELPQPVKLIFQPGEEKNPGGASLMIREGVLHSPKVTKLFALHVFPEMEVGKVGFKEGLYMASCDEVYITIHGKAGHGAMPHQCVDPIVAGAEIVQSLQTIVSRKCDPKTPCVLSIGYFEALGATNIIPSKAVLKGTFRTMDETWRKEAHEIIAKNIQSIAVAHGATADVEIRKGYPFLRNSPEETATLRQKAMDYLGKEKVEELPIRLTAEDFSYYSQEVPVCFFRLGVRNETKGIVHGVHHPKFDIDNDALTRGMEILTLAVI